MYVIVDNNLSALVCVRVAGCVSWCELLLCVWVRMGVRECECYCARVAVGG